MVLITLNFSRYTTRIAGMCVAANWWLTAVLVFQCLETSGAPLMHVTDPNWRPATATWYGSPEGDGSDGGACGYGSLVDVKPFRARVGAVSPILFKGGEGCGACYKVKCLDQKICSPRPVTVIITDECPGGYCSGGNTHFDLSGAAFGRMAVAGGHSQLRNRGVLNIMYHRFIYTMLGLGATLCLITCSGHIAAETANGCCLYLYLVFVILLLMLEGAVTADVFLNRNWEEDFPKDPSRNFNAFKDFIKENFEMCKWVGLVVVSVQGLSLVLALILKGLGPHEERHYDSDDDYYTLEEVPVLRNFVNKPSYVVGAPVYGTR